jgi:hypothetical protein
VTGAGLEVVAGACAKEATATPLNKVAAIRVLIFNMVNSHSSLTVA